MPTMFVANTTKQHHDFVYRMPESGKQVLHHIRAGAQIQINGDTPLFDTIIEQHKKYGLIESKALQRGRAFHGLVFQFERPMNADAITAGIHHNDNALQFRGEDARKAAAVASTNIVEQEALKAGATGGPVTVEIVEQRMGPNDTVDAADKQRQTIEVTRDLERADNNKVRRRK